MYTQLKERIKQHEGFRRSIYSDSLGFATIGYGHLVLPTDNFVEGVEYTKEELDAVFDNDFQIALTSAQELLEEIEVPETVLGVIVEMCFQLGKPRVMKFKKMWAAIHEEDFTTASKEMLDSRWANQVKSRSTKLAHAMYSGQM